MLFKKAADLANDDRALDEIRADLGVHYHIEVSLAVAHLDIDKAVKFLRKRRNRLRRERYFASVDRKLARLRDEGVSAHQNYIAHFEIFLKFSVILLADAVARVINLNIAALIFYVCKGGFARNAL